VEYGGKGPPWLTMASVVSVRKLSLGFLRFVSMQNCCRGPFRMFVHYSCLHFGQIDFAANFKLHMKSSALATSQSEVPRGATWDVQRGTTGSPKVCTETPAEGTEILCVCILWETTGHAEAAETFRRQGPNVCVAPGRLPLFRVVNRAVGSATGSTHPGRVLGKH